MQQLIAQQYAAEALKIVQIVWKHCMHGCREKRSMSDEKENHVHLMQAGQTFTNCAPFHFAEPSSLDVHALL
jgi:hypothetical protein